MIKVKFFNEFEIEYNGKKVGDNISKSKKNLSLLAYILLSKGKNTSKEVLMDLLWDDEKSGNPANALKTTIHRIRTILDKLEHSEELLVQENGTYCWNKIVPTFSDVTEFELQAKTVMNPNESDEKRLDCYRKASELYTGDFLQRNQNDAWIIPLRTYYRSIFLSSTYEAIRILEKIQDYTEAEKISEKAVLVDPYDENLHYCLVKSRIKQGKRTAALEHYNYTIDMLHEKFEVSPSPEFIKLYRDITEQTHLENTNLEDIMDQITEEPNKKAFICNFEMFKDMYQFKARILATKQEDSYLYLITIRAPEKSVISDSAGKLKRHLSSNLSKSSVITRYSHSQFLIMILNEPKDISEKKIQKILTKFKKDNPSFNVEFEVTGSHIRPATDT